MKPPEPTIGDNSETVDEAETLKDQIAAALAGVEAYDKISNDKTAAKALSLRNRLSPTPITDCDDGRKVQHGAEGFRGHGPLHRHAANHTNEQFAALMMVAKEYDLNPLLKEIYAFPAKGGGIVPIVSIDGWVNLVNSHPACDGFEFEFEHAEDGTLISCTCRMYRKDRGRPVSVTEYLNECIRSTDPWKMKHRMLRHKAMIQAARYAFGFSGIYDEDEGSKIAEIKDITPPKPPVPPAPPEEKVLDCDIIEADAVIENERPAGAIDPREDANGADFDPTEFFQALEAEMAEANTVEDVEEVWTARDPMAVFDGDDVNQGIAKAIKNRRLKEIGGAA